MRLPMFPTPWCLVRPGSCFPERAMHLSFFRLVFFYVALRSPFEDIMEVNGVL